MRKWKGLFAVVAALLSFAASAAHAQQPVVTVRGFVTDATDGQALVGANVVFYDEAETFVEGTAAGRDGFYRLRDLPAGTYIVRTSFVGYAPAEDTLRLGAEAFRTHSVALVPAPEALGEVVVGAEGGAARMQAGLQTVRPADLQRIPTPDLSGDLASYLQSLPSIVSLGDRGGQLYIRGGTPSQNLVLVDGLPIFQPFHIVGFFSAFPQDLVSSANLYAGGFGARYSGRISSVIDVAMRDGNTQGFEGAATISPFLASLRAEGPLQRGRVSWLASVRTSVIEETAPTFIGDELPFQFGDVYLKITNSGRANSRCSLSTLYTYDRGGIARQESQRDEVFRWKNFVLGGRCVAFPPDNVTLFDVTGGVSYVQNEVGSAVSPERSSDALQVNTNLNLTTTLRGLEIGVGATARATWLGYTLGGQFLNVRSDESLLIAASGYGEIKLPITRRLLLTPGLSASVFPAPYKLSLEPRLRLTWQPGGPDGRFELNAAAGVYRQTLIGISDERDAGSVFLAWIPGPVDGAQARALHGLGGLQLRLGSGFHFAAEGYYKRLDDLPVPIWSVISRFTTTLTLAEGESYGADARLEFRRRPFYAFVGYGASWTRYSSSQENFGVWFGGPVQHYHPPHDRRHQLSALLSLELRRLTASVRWQFGTGLPFTQLLGFDDLLPPSNVNDVRRDARTPRALFERPFRGRLPTYHRLDVSVERAFPFGFGVLTVQAGAINAYDRTNLFYYDVFTLRRVNQLPIVPFVGLKLEAQ